VDITADQLEKLVTDAAKSGAEAAVRAVNTVDDKDRPAGAGTGAVVSNVNLKRPQTPRLSKMIQALRSGDWSGAELERDLSQATEGRYNKDHESRSVSLPANPFAFATIVEEADLPVTDRPALKEWAVRAAGEATVAAGGALVPPQWLQEQFAPSLQTAVAFRNAPGVESIPVVSNSVLLPRETVMPTSAGYAEAGTITASDATFAQQTITIKKQAAYNVFSNELLADSTPAYEAYIAKSLARSLALFQDQQFIEGSGSGNNLTGMGSYSGLTTGYTPAANGDSYSAAGAADKLINLVFNLRTAGVEPNAWIMHPRVMQSLSTLKDSNNRYILASIAGNFGAPVAIPGAGTLQTSGTFVPPVWKGMLLGIPVLLTAQISILETQGTSTNATHLYVGDFTFGRVLDRQAIEMALSEHILFTNDQTAVRVSARSGLALIVPAAFIKQSGIIP